MLERFRGAHPADPGFFAGLTTIWAAAIEGLATLGRPTTLALCCMAEHSPSQQVYRLQAIPVFLQRHLMKDLMSDQMQDRGGPAALGRPMSAMPISLSH